MKRHKTLLLRLATNLSSREAGFVFALFGVLVQAAHTWFLAYDLSSLPGIWRLLQAGLMALFISAALLYFTLKSSDEDTKSAKKYRKIVWWFACVETFINLYYWGDHLLIKQWPTPDYGSFIIAIPFSILLPFVLKSYGSEVRTEDYSELIDDENSNQENVDIDKLNNDLDALLEENEKLKKEKEDTLALLANREEPLYPDPPQDEDPEHVDVKFPEDYPQDEDPEPVINEYPDPYDELEPIPDPEPEQTPEPEQEPEPTPNPEPIPELEYQISSTDVFDAQGNKVNTEEPAVRKPIFGRTKEQVVLRNGGFSSDPAYVHPSH